MNTFEIEKTVSRDIALNKHFLGVFPSDKLPKVIDTPACFIANTDPIDKPGEHWVALFFDKYVEYFDSYGLEPLDSFKIYHPEVINRFCLQSFDSTVCGQYCIYFLHERSRGKPFEHIINSLLARSNSDNFVKVYVDRIRICGIRPDCQSCTFRNEGCQHGSLRKVL